MFFCSMRSRGARIFSVDCVVFPCSMRSRGQCELCSTIVDRNRGCGRLHNGKADKG